MKPCRVCGRLDNRIQIRAGSGICCNQCEKIENKELNGQKALDYLWPLTSNWSDAQDMFDFILNEIQREAKDA